VESELFQRWIAIRADSSISSISQDDEDWIDVADVTDAVFWVDVRELTSSGAQLFLNIETSPTRDEALFVPAAPPIALTPSSSPLITKTARGAASLAPMGRWARWRIYAVGAPNASWDAQFRIRMARSRTAFFTPPQLTGCLLWLRSDLGIPENTTTSFGTGAIWADQSGYGNSATAAGAGNVPYSANGGANNLPTVNSVSNATAFFSNASLVGPFGGTHTLFVVATYQASPMGTPQCCAFAATNATLHIDSGFAQFTQLTTVDLYGRVSSSTFTNSDAGSSITPSGTVGVYATAADSSNVSIWVNGTKTNQDTVTIAPATPGGYVVLAQSSVPDNPVQAPVYEFIIYNRVLSANEFIIVNRYLGGRYGVAVP
jgi:hypothetical protein